ncbi:hypothetical protein A2331_06585 [Candidatus Falkowbacteria bacterium RIFOXYB2_FULL_34_18]|uniref:Aldehyde ferredoxin oxidoreductase N-terminal domain-containing protein n=1 Tax=Candidatus Falkowbacteria bacterium RIFOXYD2_FULL_34_120 TaxID=1798007 RepID=A0A1F5TRI8_9BACT|nr:MAG: hypothetical protein A2331_06585 [Candidatus Falkowbacteria bacterium RIFOXYB2_FULL_34_18]OGF30012.1 MAG: hypothetical protein A2500_04095 [Candidatus Falkowbacteria bacterium RIFOXYC12_FULL_34_55]OGF37131.1 MAG: hypothetical protein A2466_02425 [Candidatus Falkowbacteria bacterium RIFOXYC2_FULL_34_220]OGF39548.1 MAG: hypothetical protein A2515_04460 [Candidatus Falkowbacteria bacterium RIFOXYD12_FULL_34_57]OGF41469.1 MAG: hypothetical protein A2531_02140 [Candidatus Falkowbacteria bact
MFKNYLNRLFISLNDLRWHLETIPVSALSFVEKLGGIGQSVPFMREYLKEHPKIGKNALSPDNPLCLDIGLLSGRNIVGGARTIFTSISPLKTSKNGTNGIYFSAVSGLLSPAMRSQDIDSIVITGKSDEPIYLLIKRIGGSISVAFNHAEGLQGLMTHEKSKKLTEIHANSACAVIGPGGEKKSRIANIAVGTYDQAKNGTHHMRYAGRGGLGAVMGSKNLLAIVVSNNKEKKLFPKDIAAEINKWISTNPASDKYRNWGTYFANTPTFDAFRACIENNFSSPAGKNDIYLEDLEKIGLKIKNKGCLGCTIRCWKEVLDIENNNENLGKIDFEPGKLLGANLGIYDMRQRMTLIRIGDYFGVDTISLGVCLGYEMERQEKLGNFKFARKLALAICSGAHELSEGLFRYVKKNGFRQHYAMHVKGLELAAYLGNYNPGYAFAIAGPHTSHDTYKAAYNDDYSDTAEEWAGNNMRGPKILLYDMICLCKFAKAKLEQIAAIYNWVYDENIKPRDLLDSALAVYFIMRDIDERLGFREEDDDLPGRCFEDLWGKDAIIPHFNTTEFFHAMKEAVYKAMAAEKERLIKKGFNI